MNDDELKNRLRALRMPAPEVNEDALESALAAFRRAEKPSGGTRRPWHAWLWPSPYAWGAIAAIWLIILGTGTPGQPSAMDASARDASPGQFSFSPGDLTASTDYREALRQIEQSRISQ
jgi:hypothetical protein